MNLSNDNTYDIVVVGAGLGGLLSAVILVKEGFKVCVLEKDKQIGGCLQTFSFNKKVFDSCVHYIGGLGEGHTLNKIFSYAGIMDKLELAEYDANAFDHIAFGNEPIEYPQAQGEENFIEQLLPHFPEEREALQNYIDQIRYVGDHFPLYRLRNGDGSEKDAVSNWRLLETFDKITANKKLQSVLAGNNLLYAGVKGITPFYLHALVLSSYIHSSHKIVPGSSQIAKFLWREIQEHGGTVLKDSDVTKLHTKDGVVTHASTKDGQEIFGKQFISNIHPQILLPLLDNGTIRPAYRKRIDNLEQTVSSFMTNLVLQPKTIPMRHSNLYWNATEDVWQAIKYKPEDWPANYILFYTEDKQNKGFAESISVLSYMYYDEVLQWEDTHNRAGDEHHRSDEYESFKQRKEELLLNKIYERLPELKGNIVASKTATPLTYRDYTGTPEGSLYGVQKDINQFGAATIPIKTKIPNLYLTGQNVNLHGVLGVSITAIATSAEFVGMEHLLNKINA